MSIPRTPLSARTLFPDSPPQTPGVGAPRQQTRRLGNVLPIPPETTRLSDVPLTLARLPLRNTVRFELDDLVDAIVERELRIGRIRRDPPQDLAQPNTQRPRLEVVTPNPESPEGDEYVELPPLNRDPSQPSPE